MSKPVQVNSTSISDIEECATNKDNCHDDANCTNTKGSFYCTCHTGYSGDGVTCEGEFYKDKFDFLVVNITILTNPLVRILCLLNSGCEV